jgi:hypothetical protein
MELVSGNIKLRPLSLADAKRIVELANNEKISRNLRDGFPNPYTLPDAESFLTKFTNQDRLHFLALNTMESM